MTSCNKHPCHAHIPACCGQYMNNHHCHTNKNNNTGGAHVTAIVLFSLTIVTLRYNTNQSRLGGSARRWQYVAMCAASAAFVIVAMQLSGRMATAAFAYQQGPLAPFEAVEYALSAASWLLALCVLVTQRNSYATQFSWMWRFPIWLIFAGEITKLRCGVQM